MAANPLLLAHFLLVLGSRFHTPKRTTKCHFRPHQSSPSATAVSLRLARASTGRPRASARPRSSTRPTPNKVSGIVPFAERPSGARLLEDCQRGLIGEIHFWELSRLGRDTFDILATVQKFVKMGVQVIVATEGFRLLDDSGKLNSTASIIVAVLSALAGIERTNIWERKLQGIVIAKAQDNRGTAARVHGEHREIPRQTPEPANRQAAR